MKAKAIDPVIHQGMLHNRLKTTVDYKPYPSWMREWFNLKLK